MTGVAQANRLAVFLDVGDHQHFRVSLQAKLAQHMNLQATETSAEGYLLRRRDALAAKHRNMMIEMRTMETAKFFFGQWKRQVKPDDFRAERAVEGCNGETLYG
jgi:hypothetical protein